MGDRVLFRFVDSTEGSPVIYSHSGGYCALSDLAAFFATDNYTKRPQDVGYNSARFVAYLGGIMSQDGHSLGLWNEDSAGDAWLKDKSNTHGDAGLVLVDFRTKTVRVAHGYLTRSAERDANDVEKLRAVGFAFKAE